MGGTRGCSMAPREEGRGPRGRAATTRGSRGWEGGNDPRVWSAAVYGSSLTREQAGEARSSAPTEAILGETFAHVPDLDRHRIARPDLDAPRSPRQERERGAHPLLDRAERGIPRELGGPPGLVRPASEAAESGHHVLILFPSLSFASRLIPSSGPGTGESCRLPLLGHEPGAEHPLRLYLIVHAAPQPQSVHGRGPSSCDRLDVIELEETARTATTPVRARERALSLVALPHRTPDVRGDVAGACLRGAPDARGPGSDLPLLELLDQGSERPVEHLGHVARGNRMAEQRLRTYQAFVGGLVDRDPDEETLRRGLRPRTRNLLQRKFAPRPIHGSGAPFRLRARSRSTCSSASSLSDRPLTLGNGVTDEHDGTAARDTPNRAARAASISNFFRFVAASTSASTFWAVR